jgi:hypothetical protein
VVVTASSGEIAPPEHRYCEGTDSAAHNDEVQHPCSRRAIVECFTIHGRWQAMCERHAQGYEGERRRHLAGWWTKHPAYTDLVDSFRGSTRMPEHLAFLALVGLRRRGWDVSLSDSSEAGS